jgi:transposase
MLDEGTRAAVLALKGKGLNVRRIARTLRISRGVVRKVVASGTTAAPKLERAEKAEPFRDRIAELYLHMKGNLARVHEEITAEGLALSYPALTSYCRRHGIGVKEKPPAGRYHFEPGQEMQHDTSPHVIEIGGRMTPVQTASLVLCHSRRMFFQFYPTFTRFDCKVFLTDALRHFGGSCGDCIIDNTHVVVLRGTGRDMVPVPEMEAFAAHLGFTFKAHARGHADRSARVERPFHYIENNFEVGRSGVDFADWNAQAIEWSEKDSGKYRRRLGASPRELFALEQAHLRPLPDWIPEVYLLHYRTVDVEGYVCVGQNRYSVPIPVGRMVPIRETKERIIVYDGPRIVADHARIVGRKDQRVTDPAHRPARGARKAAQPRRETAAILSLAPELATYVGSLEQRGRGSTVRALRHLLTMVRDYPREPLVAALSEAGRFGLFDMDRIERMVLKRIGRDFFPLAGDRQEEAVDG